MRKSGYTVEMALILGYGEDEVRVSRMQEDRGRTSGTTSDVGIDKVTQKQIT